MRAISPSSAFKPCRPAPRSERRDTRWPAALSRAASAQASSSMSGRIVASAELIEAVVKLEAWETGRDSLLWAIHELDRVDKDRLLLSVAVTLTGIYLDGDSYELTVAKKFSGGDPAGPLALAPLRWTPLPKKAPSPFSSPDGANLGPTRHLSRPTVGSPSRLKHGLGGAT
jgi:hypothetical protein